MTDITMISPCDPAHHLNIKFEAYCRAEFSRWSSERGNRRQLLMPIWNPGWWFDRANQLHRRWCEHIDPLAASWWQQRGYTFSYVDGVATIAPLPATTSASDAEQRPPR